MWFLGRRNLILFVLYSCSFCRSESFALFIRFRSVSYCVGVVGRLEALKSCRLECCGKVETWLQRGPDRLQSSLSRQLQNVMPACDRPVIILPVTPLLGYHGCLLWTCCRERSVWIYSCRWAEARICIRLRHLLSSCRSCRGCLLLCFLLLSLVFVSH